MAIEFEKIESADGTWWTEIRPGRRSNGNELCRHSSEHLISAGAEYIEIVRSRREQDGGTKSEGHQRYCLEHAPEAISDIREREARSRT